MRTRIVFALALAMAAVPLAPAAAKSAPSGRNAPSLEACKPIAPAPDDELQRRKPIPIPRVWSGIARSDRTHLAISTLGGPTLCIDISAMEGIFDATLTPDGGFAEFGWGGYEIAGHMLVDRRGKGAFFDTGEKPVPSPSGKLRAALQYSEAGFGTLEGFGVWDVARVPMREVARLTLPEGMTDWRMIGWRGDSCIPLSAIKFEDLAQSEAEEGKEPRQYFLARMSRGKWRISGGEPSACPVP